MLQHSSTHQHASRTCARRPRRTRSAQTRPRSRKVLLTARSFALEPARESHKAQSQAHCSKKESHAKMSAVMSMRKQSKLPVLHLQATPSAAQKREGIERPLRHFLVVEAANEEVWASCRRATRREWTAPSASLLELLFRTLEERRTARSCHRAAPVPPLARFAAPCTIVSQRPHVVPCVALLQLLLLLLLILLLLHPPPLPPLPPPPDLSGKSCGVHTAH